MADLTTLDAITKTFYVNNKVVNQLHAKSVLYDRTAKKAQTDVGGKSYTYAIRTGRNRYAGRGIAESGDYGTIGSQATSNIVVPNAEIVTGIELSSRVINATNGGNKSAFVSAFRMETEYGMKDTMQSLNRQLHSDGTDALAFAVGADDTTPALYDDGQGNAFPIFLEGTGTTLVDVVDASDHSTLLGEAIPILRGAEGATSVSLSWASGSISGTADGDYLVMSGTLGKQMMGIRGIVSDANPPLLSGGLHGITVAANPDWKAQVFDNGGTKRALTRALMQAPLTQIGLRSSVSEADIDLMLCNGYVKDEYIKLLVAEQTHEDTTVLKGGQTAISFNGKQLVVDPYCRRNVIYYINTDSLDFLTATNGLSWADWDGKKWQRKIGSSGYAAAYQAFITIEGNLACKQRNANALLADITD